MTTFLTILTEGYADWETALLNAVAKGYYNVETRFATPGGEPVTSAGGLRVTPDLAVEDVGLDDFDVLLVNGGTAWSRPDAPDIGRLAREAVAAGKIVGGICDGTLALAHSGVLDTVRHTSNSAENLPKTGYKGAELYEDVPYAVTDGRIVTAPGTAPVSFMAAILDQLGLKDADLDFYLGLHGAEHKGLTPAA
jgi:Transcriptional regulator containing an amidase domain and an AraC-type DNA-binding HTH domain